MAIRWGLGLHGTCWHAVGAVALLWATVGLASEPTDTNAPQAVQEQLTRGLRDFDLGRFERSVTGLERILGQPGLSNHTSAQAYLYLGMNNTVLGRRQQAEQAFKRALSHDPELELDPQRTKRSIVEAFQRARSQLSGEIEVTGQPPGSLVLVDGQRLGTLPWRGRLAVGRHQVAVRAPGPNELFAEHRESVLIFPDGKLAVAVQLVARAGLLRVNTVPEGTEVRVDGQPRGASPLQVALAPGKRKVEVTRAGYALQRRDVVVAPGRTTQLTIELMPVPVALQQLAVERPAQPKGGRLWTWIAAGGAAAALAAATGFAIAAESDYRGFNEAAAGGDREQWERLRDSGQDKSVVSTSLFITAGVLSVTAAVLYFWVEAPEG